MVVLPIGATEPRSATRKVIVEGAEEEYEVKRESSKKK
jgi:hypothetical protein